MGIFCNNINVFTVTFEFNASLLNESINYFIHFKPINTQNTAELKNLNFVCFLHLH